LLLAPASIHVDADGVRLQQVFSNLLTNAAKFTPDGGTIWVKAMTEDTEAVVRIEDNGIGIEPDMLLYIFDLFAQVQAPKGNASGNEPGGAGPTSASGPNAAAGLGIGLSLVKELVTLHGGTVQANSDGIGKGSVFTIRLPSVEGDNAKSRPAAERNPD
jgi:signal transduction histidine kinase